MPDENVNKPDPSPDGPDQLWQDGQKKQRDQRSKRRHIIVTSLLAPPTVMTLGARGAYAKGSAHHSSAMSSIKKG